jgi:hypothetical protein
VKVLPHNFRWLLFSLNSRLTLIKSQYLLFVSSPSSTSKLVIIIYFINSKMKAPQENKRQTSRQCCFNTLLVIINLIISSINVGTSAQSIGYHPQFNFGFNPYFSPVFGYGLGIPYGAYNISPTRYPWLLSGIPSVPFADKTGLMSKIHAKAFLTKLATSQVFAPGYYGIKDKLNLMKHPENAYTPYGAGYGYGKHYGAALVPNNPYKSVYSDYYDKGVTSASGPAIVGPAKPNSIPIGGKLLESSNVAISVKPYTHYLKPFMKAGALLTTAAILGKKIFQAPAKLNPAGMIIDELRP